MHYLSNYMHHSGYYYKFFLLLMFHRSILPKNTYVFSTFVHNLGFDDNEDCDFVLEFHYQDLKALSLVCIPLQSGQILHIHNISYHLLHDYHLEGHHLLHLHQNYEKSPLSTHFSLKK